MTNVGEKAPDFALPNQDGKEIKLNDFIGKKVLLAFYPLDFSPVCTQEMACFADDLAELESMNLVVLGISVDSKYCHREFATKMGIKFNLLSDLKRNVCRAYGVLREEGYSERAYFLIDEKGILRYKHVMPTLKEKLENKELVRVLSNL